MNRILLSAAVLMLATGAQAHVTLEQPQASAGSSYKAVLRIGHGCSGSPTHTLRVSLPAGLRGAKPMPKPGWQLALRSEPLAEPYDSHGRRITEDVVEITWRAAAREAWLADVHYDEFVLRAELPPRAGPLWFKVTQLCENGTLDWTEIPATGTSTRGLKSPAVLLDVQPAAAPAHHH